MDNNQLLDNIKVLLDVHVRTLNEKIEKQNVDFKERFSDLRGDVKSIEMKMDVRLSELSKDHSKLSSKVAVAETNVKSNSSIFGAIGGMFLALLTTVIVRFFGL